MEIEEDRGAKQTKSGRPNHLEANGEEAIEGERKDKYR